MGSGMPDELTGKASPLARSNFELNVNKLRKEFKQAFFFRSEAKPPLPCQIQFGAERGQFKKGIDTRLFFSPAVPPAATRRAMGGIVTAVLP